MSILRVRSCAILLADACSAPHAAAPARRCLAMALMLSLSLAACRRQPPPAAPQAPQASGTLVVSGLKAPVRIVRDRWGVPHVYAENQDDLFFAQGFVQAQDRLFQMDLWRRSTGGRLSEVLGANFIERDAMTRRMQYHGDLRQEWDSYGPDAEAIASAFVRGVNAWVGLSRDHLPEEFALAGWRPEPWTPNDLLNRTDAFVAGANALDEVFNARLVAAVGSRSAEALLSMPAGRLSVPAALDIGAVSYVISDALRGVGAPPFFSGLAAPVLGAGPAAKTRNDAIRDHSDLVGSNAWAIAGARSATGAPLLAADPHRLLDHPSSRYLIHLTAPGWNVVGATAPWLPGVAIGHNDHVAWAMTSRAADVQDLYVEKANPDNPHQVLKAGRWVSTKILPDSIAVKGRAKPFPFERESTSHGVMFATDRGRHLAFAVKWTGFEPGGAAELGSLLLDRASSEAELTAAIDRWRAPAATFVYATRDGRIGERQAGLVPVRPSWSGALPAPAWTGQYEWQGWVRAADLSPSAAPSRGFVANANESLARTRRLDEVLAPDSRLSLDDFKALQLDTQSWTAQQLVPLLESLHGDRDEVEQARLRLVRWNRRLTADSPEATLYESWIRRLWRALVVSRIDPALADDFIARQRDVLVPAMTNKASAWFAGRPPRWRADLLLQALEDAVDAPEKGAWGALHTALFHHPLGATAAARQRFDVGPFKRGGDADTVMATGGVDLEQSRGASLRVIADVGDWDRSLAINAPGQSGSPASPHFADLAKLWAVGDYFALPFTEAAVREHQESTLILAPHH